MSNHPRYRLIAYVCEGGVVHEVHEEGRSTFSRVFRNNPDGCRYAVVQCGGEFWVFDIYDAKMGLRGDMFFPGRYHVLPTEDAAIAAATMLPHSRGTTGDYNMFGTTHFDSTNVADYASALAYFNAMKPWRGETAPTDERPMLHRRARHLGVRNDAGVIRFRLHRTDVVSYYPDGSILLDVYASATTDSFANAILDWSILTSFNSGYVVVDGLAYRAIDTVLIDGDRNVKATQPWSRYVVDRKRMNAAIREHAPQLPEAVKWLKAAEALGALTSDYNTDMFSHYSSLRQQLECLKDRSNWKCLTEWSIENLREKIAAEWALVETDPVDGIDPSKINSYRAAWRKWGHPR